MGLGKVVDVAVALAEFWSEVAAGVGKNCPKAFDVVVRGRPVLLFTASRTSRYQKMK